MDCGSIMPDGTQDGSYTKDYRESFPKEDFLRTYGYASGIVGLRLFPNPAFDKAAEEKWMAELKKYPDGSGFYTDKDFYKNKHLVRPFRVGMACGFCHVAPHPLHPPADPEHPAWGNLSSNIGNQYLKAAAVFVLPHNEGNFLYPGGERHAARHHRHLGAGERQPEQSAQHERHLRRRHAHRDRRA